MARNLRDKIRVLLGDAYDIRQESMITKIENLIKEELQLKDEERDITYQDLAYVQDLAVQEYSKMRMDQEALGYIQGDAGLIRTLCSINATVVFLRKQGLLSCILKYKK